MTTSANVRTYSKKGNDLFVDFADLFVEFADLFVDYADLFVDFADLLIDFADSFRENLNVPRKSRRNRRSAKISTKSACIVFCLKSFGHFDFRRVRCFA